MQPTATTAWVRPVALRSAASSSVSTESFFADSTNPHVLTTTVSASAGSPTSRNPSASSRPASSSESTSLRAHPRVTMATDSSSRAGAGLVSVVMIAPEYGNPRVPEANPHLGRGLAGLDREDRAAAAEQDPLRHAA